ncbi:thioesterase family protein [Mycobacterium shigaense]|uniref:thioesterase family protein n=1 Tax=Mycobacterium shigaense TaxID=722731 RepID=UPI002ADF6BD5|nr:thioesterase family protein [Mycobacterium shigaense]MEA1123192.1 thioesterase family protein [Mycobacterium shigaense]
MTDSTTVTRPFTDLTTIEPTGAGTFAATIDPMWTIGSKVHGGCLMALCGAAAHQALGEVALSPIALGANYLSAPDPGEVRLSTSVRRRGRQVCLVDVELSQRDRLAVRCTITLGHLDVDPPRHQETHALTGMAAEPGADAIPVNSESPVGQIIHVSQGCDLRLDPTASGFLDGKVGPPITRMWLRPLVTDEVDPDKAALFAIMAGDISPPVIMQRGFFGWTPTVQLTTYLRRLPSPGWMRVMASSTLLGDTWFEEDHVIVDAAGHIVAQSRQLALLPKQNWQPE